MSDEPGSADLICKKCKHVKCEKCKIPPMFYHFYNQWICCNCGRGNIAVP